MATENQPAAVNGGNVAKARSKRTKEKAQTTQTSSPSRTTSPPQQGQEEPIEEVPMFVQILNWVMFFFVLQSVVSFFVNKAIAPDEQPTSISSHSSSDVDRMDVLEVGNSGESLWGASEEGPKAGPPRRNKGKPLGAGPSSFSLDSSPERLDIQKARGRGKPMCLWQRGTVMDLEVVFTDSPTVPFGWPPLTTDKDRSNDSDTDGNYNDHVESSSSSSNSAGGVHPRRTKVKLGNSIESNRKDKKQQRWSNDGRKGSQILAKWEQNDLVLGGATDPRSSGTSSSLFSFSSPAAEDLNYRNDTLIIPLTESIWNNETHLYAYVRLQRRRRPKKKAGNAANSLPAVRRDDVLVKKVTLTRHRKRKRMRDEKSLLESQKEKTSQPESPNASSGGLVDPSILTAASLNKTHDQILLYIKPSLTLQLVDLGGVDFPTRSSIPSQFANHMDWYEGEADSAGGASNMAGDFYYPIFHSSEFWITYGSLKEVNGTLKESNVDLIVEPISMWKWQLQSQMEDSWKKQEAFTGEEDRSNDVLRTMLLETNPYLLAVTAIVSMLHTVFDILAFKNDISFFKNKKSMEGLSLRSMVVNCFFSLIILLYLADNDTNFMVLASNGVGLAIDVWKISKAVTVKFEGGKIEWVEAQSYKKSKTKEYDEIATSHLLFVTMPLVAGYGIYSLFFQKHRGWYSWILNTLVGFIYMFGFVMMTPQLFINYKLQSVAHLNWRTMTYKSINTFIDDLFAFVIKMPIMHRLACLRDDVIFFIFLYQRYKYKTDYTRVNEFGQCSQPTEEMLAERETEKAGQQREEADQSKISMDTATDAVPETVRRRRGARDKKE